MKIKKFNSYITESKLEEMPLLVRRNITKLVETSISNNVDINIILKLVESEYKSKSTENLVDMENKGISPKLTIYLYDFLKDVAQGIWGESKLTYTNIVDYSNKATEKDIDVLEEFFYDWSSKLTEEDDIDVQHLEEYIFDVIER
jgi:hypothetical protein